MRRVLAGRLSAQCHHGAGFGHEIYALGDADTLSLGFCAMPDSDGHLG
jgi:hypothetical protein